MRNLVFRRTRKRRRGRVAIAAALASCVVVVGVASAAIGGFNPFGNQQVGQTYANGVLLPTNQWISPLGTRILDSTARGSSRARSARTASTWPRWAGTSSPGFLTIFDLKTGQIVSADRLDTARQRRGLLGRPRRAAVLPPDGSTLWVPQSDVPAEVQLQPDDRRSDPEGTPISRCAAPAPTHRPLLQRLDDAGVRREHRRPSDVANGAELPSGMALSPDGNTLYVALNGDNTLGVIDTADRHVDSTRSRSATRRARSCSLTTAPSPTSPTRAAVRRQSGTSPTCPTARRSCPAGRPGGRSPARSRWSTSRPARRRRRFRSASSRPRSTRTATRCSSPTPTTTACR